MLGQTPVQHRESPGIVAVGVALSSGDLHRTGQTLAAVTGVVLGVAGPVDAEPVASDIDDGEAGRRALFATGPENAGDAG